MTQFEIQFIIANSMRECRGNQLHPHNTQQQLRLSCSTDSLYVCARLLHEWREIKQPNITQRVSSELLNAQDKVIEQSLLDDLTSV